MKPAIIETCEVCGKRQGFRTIFGKVMCEECFRAWLLKALATGVFVSVIILFIAV